MISDAIKPAQILVIDDEPVICDGCRLVLCEKGHTVDTCGTGQDGMEAVRRNGYELILLDLKLPDADGMDLLKRLQEEKPRTPVIVMTAFSSVQNAVAAMKQGAFDYLSKPFSDDQLVFAAEKALAAKRLTEENLALRKQLYAMFDFSNIVGENPQLLQIFDEIRKAAPTDSTILLQGESGTGKELFAKAIHAHSKRSSRQFVAADCSTFSASLLESELFGHVKGAYTGAVSDKAGIFEMAKGGTLFLDEVANLSIEIQGKLLRVMELQEFKPVGGSVYKKTDIRIIAATNQDLKELIRAGRFRDDFFYRLNVVPLYLPPLRERKDDVPKLAYHFLRIFCRDIGKRIEGFSDDALELLIQYDWPGNIRQLKNVVERLVILTDGDVLSFEDLIDHMYTKTRSMGNSVPGTVDELKAAKKKVVEKHYARIEKAFLMKALSAAGGNITEAANRTGMQRSNFSTLMKKHGLSRDSEKPAS
ncbi:MAG: sigma-54 dependent transcriptional regulator [Desulfobacterales bacterium]|nr:sigma-54 dependent transcriptional regulator [Desulfobacterales bacterium]